MATLRFNISMLIRMSTRAGRLLQLIDQKVAKWILNIVIVAIIVQHT